MPTIVKMPQLGESVVEGTVARWLKAPGDAIAKLEPLLEITTDKIDTEVPAPAEGVLLEIIVPEGQTVKAGATLAYIGAVGERVGSAGSEKREERNLSSPPKPTGRAFISPVVGRIVAKHGVDLDQLTGTGLDGRITKKDVLAYVEQRQREETVEIKEIKETKDWRAEHAISNPQSPISQFPDEILHPLTAIRRAIAQHMVQSKQTSPHVTTIFEVDMTAVVRHREVHKTAFAGKGIKLTFTPYFVAATAAALRKAPLVNSRFTEEGIMVNRRIHIGIAVALEGGLVVPVIRDADEKNLWGLARAVNDLAERARTNALHPDDLKGGTFTITNHGVGGSLAGAPIINQPQAAILGVGAIVKRPVVHSNSGSLLPSADDAIVIRPMCYLSLSFDHRVFDGAQADGFLTEIKERLENWTKDGD